MKLDQNILYVATHGLGDLIMSLPAIEFLSDQGYRLTVLVKDSTQKDYLEHTTNFKQGNVLALDEYLKLGTIKGKALLIWRLWLLRFTGAVPQMNLNPRLFGFLTLMACVKKRKSSVLVLKKALNNYPRVRSKHKVDFNIEMAAQIMNINPPSTPSPVWLSRPVKSKLKPRIALAPGSGEIESFKRWPASHYAALSINLMSLFPNAVIEVFGAPNEAKLCSDIETQSNGAASFLGVGSVTDLYDALKDCDVCIANCNGASHVAAHAGTIVVGIYGPTQAAFTGAHCNSMFEVNRKLECSPCYRKGYISGCGNPVCLTELEVDAVTETVRRILS